MDKSISHPEFGWVMIASSNCLRDTLSTMEELSRYGKVEECIFSSNPREREQFQTKGFQNLHVIRTQSESNHQRKWKQPRCPSADEWIRKLWYIYTMEYYSAVKKNTFESVLMRWMKLEPIIQSEVSHKEKHQYSILTHIYGI